MSVILTKSGFVPETWTTIVGLKSLADEAAGTVGAVAVDFPNDRDPADLAPWLDRLGLVRIAFPAMGDGRGFSIAARLRAMGYAGRLRAVGPLIRDQFRAARRVGFDEVELPEDKAARLKPDAWRIAEGADYRAHLFA